MQLSLLFKCDGNLDTGLGHISRCINIAAAIRSKNSSINCTFFGIYDELAKSLLTLNNLESIDRSLYSIDLQKLNLCEAEIYQEYDVVLIDSYEMDQSKYNLLRKICKKIVILDDSQILDLSTADLVICFRAGADKHNYRSRKQLLGPSFFPIKPAFKNLRKRNLEKTWPHPIRRILIFLSGSRYGFEYIAPLVAAISPLNVEIAYISKSELPQGMVQHATWIPATTEIEEVYENYDFVLCGGGLTKYECAFLAIPNACLSLTALQHADTLMMESLGLTLDLGLASEVDWPNLQTQLKNYLSDKYFVLRQRHNFLHGIHENGNSEIIKAIISL